MLATARRLALCFASLTLVATAACQHDVVEDNPGSGIRAPDAAEDELALLTRFDMNNLLTDAQLEGGANITVAQMQRFLEEQGSALATYTDPNFGQRAARLIVEKSRAENINPLYMVARIQTESSLITSGTLTHVAAATGCGCPDSGGCSASFAGFGRQIVCGAQKIRGYLDDLDAGGTTISGWRPGLTKRTLDPCSVTPRNRATAVLYTYTPWVGAYAEQCRLRPTIGGSSLIALSYHRFADVFPSDGGGGETGDSFCRGKVDGRYCDGGERVRCGGGDVVVRTACRFGCEVMPPGVPDQCFALGQEIAAKYDALGGFTSALGRPTRSTVDGPDGGRLAQFERGTITAHPEAGVHEVHGSIRNKWQSLGGASGRLGYPRSDEGAGATRGRRSIFQGGVIWWSSATGAHALHGPVRTRWRNEGADGSALGLPTSDVEETATGARADFQNGRITWNRAQNTTQITGN